MPDSEPSARILIAEDDTPVRQLLAEILKREGHAADGVQDARTALTHLVKHRYSLLITDVGMPGTSGVQLAHEIRARGLDLPILLLSTPFGEETPEASEGHMVEIAALNLGRMLVLPKPFDLAEFRTAVRHLLALPKPKGTDTPTPGKLRGS
jgi:DNA-binding response OmpR family regulator